MEAMEDNSLFFVDSKSASDNQTTGAHILFESMEVSDETFESPSVAEDDAFISVGKVVPPQLAVGAKQTADSNKSRKLQHNVDVRSRIYFSADPKSLIASSSKNRIKQSGKASNSDPSSPSSSAPSKADLLIASLLDGESSSSGNSRVKEALSKSIVTDDFGG